MNLCWSALEKGWQASFNKAWEAYISGNPPIGAAILDKNKKIISFGRHRIIDKNGESGSLYGTNLSHASVNAILQIGNLPPDEVREYTLYCTLELCPLCFGAVVMGNIKQVKFGAIDKAECAFGLHTIPDFLDKHEISIEGPIKGVQEIQVALRTCYELEQGRMGDNVILNAWRDACPHGLDAGLKLYKTGVLFDFLEHGSTVNEVIDYIGKIM